MKRLYLFAIILLFMLGLIRLTGPIKWSGPGKCIRSSKVISVDSIHYRGGYVTLENGSHIDVGQPTKPVTVGCVICLEWE